MDNATRFSDMLEYLTGDGLLNDSRDVVAAEIPHRAMGGHVIREYVDPDADDSVVIMWSKMDILIKHSDQGTTYGPFQLVTMDHRDLGFDFHGYLSIGEDLTVQATDFGEGLFALRKTLGKPYYAVVGARVPECDGVGAEVRDGSIVATFNGEAIGKARDLAHAHELGSAALCAVYRVLVHYEELADREMSKCTS